MRTSEGLQYLGRIRLKQPIPILFETLSGRRVPLAVVDSLRLQERWQALGSGLDVRFLNFLVLEALLPFAKQGAELIVDQFDWVLFISRLQGRGIRQHVETVLDWLVGRSDVPGVLDLGQMFLLNFS